MKKSFFIFLFIGLITIAKGQSNVSPNVERFVSGRITDKADGTPIPGASVFIAGTTVGAITDKEGYYRFKIPGNGSYRLVVSHVGFQSVSQDLEPGHTSLSVDLSLTIIELDEVLVNRKIKARLTDINLFWRTILGKRPSKNTIFAENPEKVYYYYNTKTKILTVTCPEPLEIVNYETGYHIQLVVNNFTHDYNTGVTTWNTEKVFTALEPKDAKEKKIWENNRELVYRVSLTHFIRSLYQNTLMENGYLLTYLHPKESLDSVYKYKPFYSKLLTTSDAGKTLSLPSDSGEMMLVCFGKPITQEELNEVIDAQKKYSPWQRVGYKLRFLIQTPGKPVQIFPDGTYQNPIKFNSQYLLESFLGLNMALPLEYNTGEEDMKTPAMIELNLDIEDELVDRFERQLSVFPQEKIYLHTDKPYYITGEKIWFRAYLADAVSHIPVPVSRYVYVELFDSSDSLIARVKIRNENDAYHGHITIPANIPEGDYTLRVYTRYMLNLDEQYLCTKHIHIGNPLTRQSEPVRAPDNDFDVTFYPEGGALLAGGLQRVAFKALMSGGSPANVEGIVYDRDGNEYNRINTAYQGMGSFMLSPKEGMSYHVVCTNDRLQTKRFDLPDVQTEGYALSAINSKDNLNVKVLTFKPEEPLYLLAHTRGFVHFSIPWNWDRELLSLPKDELPSGVLHLVLFDAVFNPVSERLVFVNNDDYAQVSFSSDINNFTSRALASNHIMLSDADGQPLKGNFSVAVTADHAVVADTSANILTHLLLTSDLRGHIENPAAYFTKDNTSVAALDLLMLTQGWRRYDLASMAQGRPAHPTVLVELGGGVISGRVKQLAFNRSVEKAQVSIVSMNGDYFDLTETDSDGRFSFIINEHPDSTMFIVHAFHESIIRVTPLELLIDDEIFPPKTHSTLIPLDVSKETVDNYVNKAFQHYRIEEDMWTLILSEVTVSANRNVDAKPARQSYYGRPSNSINVDSLAFKPYHVADVLRRIPGVVVTGQKISIRQQGNPLLVIDDVVQMLSKDCSGCLDCSECYDCSDCLVNYIETMVSVDMIEQIDILKDASNTAVFGTLGGNGVIAIYTKRGFVQKDDRPRDYLKHIQPLGYQQPVEFYAPKYDTPEKRNAQKPDLRTTIHWQPVVQTDSQGVASFEFYTADTRSPYTVIIEGLTDTGLIIHYEMKLMATP